MDYTTPKEFVQNIQLAQSFLVDDDGKIVFINTDFIIKLITERDEAIRQRGYTQGYNSAITDHDAGRW